MQKQIIHGIPYFTDKEKLYLWDGSATPIGTYVGDSITFTPNLLEHLSEKLSQWRTEQQPRIRKSAGTSARQSRASKNKE